MTRDWNSLSFAVKILSSTKLSDQKKSCRLVQALPVPTLQHRRKLFRILCRPGLHCLGAMLRHHPQGLLISVPLSGIFFLSVDKIWCFYCSQILPRQFDCWVWKIHWASFLWATSLHKSFLSICTLSCQVWCSMGLLRQSNGEPRSCSIDLKNNFCLAWLWSCQTHGQLFTY